MHMLEARKEWNYEWTRLNLLQQVNCDVIQRLPMFYRSNSMTAHYCQSQKAVLIL